MQIQILKHFAIIIVITMVVLVSSLLSCRGNQKSVFKSNTLPLLIVHGPQLNPYMYNASKAFLSSPDATLIDGTKIDINLINETALTASNRIGSGKLKVHGWLVPTTSLVNYTNSNLKNLGPKQIDCTQVFASPSVIATTSKHLSKFKAEDRVFSWKTIFNNEGESTSETPKIFFNHGSPTSNSTGLAALIQLAYVAAGLPNMLRLEDLNTPSVLSLLEKFENGSTGYGYNDQALLSQIAWARNDKVHFTITSEQEVAVYNLKRIKNKLEPLIALYPKEGSFWLDYSMCMSDADWLSPAHKKAMEVFTNFLLKEQSQAIAVAHGFRSASGSVPLTAPLSPEYGVDVNKGKSVLLPISGEAVTLLLDRWPELLKPAATMFVMDLSGSMEGASLRVGKTNFRNTIAASSWRDLKGLMSFATNVKVESKFVTEASTLIPILDNLQAQGGSAIYDSILKASQMMKDESLNNYRKAIIVFTDGADKNSEVPYNRLIDNVKDIYNRNNINLIIVAVGHDNDVEDLSAIAEAANGIFVHPTYDGLGDIFAKIRSML